MLILNRQIGERIFIGENAEIVITVLPSNNNKHVRIGLQAAEEISILREEVFRKKTKRKKLT